MLSLAFNSLKISCQLEDFEKTIIKETNTAMTRLFIFTTLLLAPLAVATAADPTTTLWFDKPATRFHQSLPLGNGRIGAMVFGGVDEERIVLNESSVWSGSPEDADRPDAHQALPEIRRLLLEGKNVEAERLVNANFTCQGQGSGHGSGANVPFGCYQTLGNLRLKFGDAHSGPTLRCASGHRAWSANQEIEFSMDGNQETKWCIIHDGRPVVWQLDAGQDGATPCGYRLTSAEDVPARDPRTWKLEGSADGKAWTLLDEHKDEPVFAKRHETRLQDRQADRGPVLPFHVRAESRRHAFPGGGDRARWRRAEDAGAGPARTTRERWTCAPPWPRSSTGRPACVSRASISSAPRRGVRLASDRGPARCAVVRRDAGPAGAI